MNLRLLAYSDNGDSTTGLLFLNDKFESYTLEDEERQEKVKGETRIPRGTYRIKFREVLSGMTKKYREKYSWFTWHLELQDVPGFKYVYIHIGNKDKDTDGCILVGDIVNNNNQDTGMVGSSGIAYKRLYQKLEQALNKGEDVWIEVTSI